MVTIFVSSTVANFSEQCARVSLRVRLVYGHQIPSGRYSIPMWLLMPASTKHNWSRRAYSSSRETRRFVTISLILFTHFPTHLYSSGDRSENSLSITGCFSSIGGRCGLRLFAARCVQSDIVGIYMARMRMREGGGESGIAIYFHLASARSPAWTCSGVYISARVLTIMVL